MGALGSVDKADRPPGGRPRRRLRPTESSEPPASRPHRVPRQPALAHPIPGLIAGRPIAPPLFPDTDCEALRKSVEEAFRTEVRAFLADKLPAAEQLNAALGLPPADPSRLRAEFSIEAMRDRTIAIYEDLTRRVRRWTHCIWLNPFWA